MFVPVSRTRKGEINRIFTSIGYSLLLHFKHQKMKEDILSKLTQKLTLPKILILAFLLRFIAVIFAQGFGYHDDHFLIIEASQSWVDGHDYNHWLPWNQEDPKPEGHSFFYVGVHFCFFWIMDALANFSPAVKMFIIRLLHALMSLLVVYFSYTITLRISDKKNAINVGFLMAVFWIFPWLSVRNLVEMFCIPFLLGATHLLYKQENKPSPGLLIWAGFIAGLAFSCRFQTGFYILGLGISTLFIYRIKSTIYFSIGVIFSILLIQGGIDLIIWKRPFAEMTEYILYNLANKYSYGTGAWYTYVSLLTGLLFLPLGLIYWYGFYKASSRKSMFVWLPTLLFLIFHSFYPNKQERFIFTIIPMFILLGQTGLYLANQENKKSFRRFLDISLCIFLILNTLLLPLTLTYYGKKARVESMKYLSKYENINYLMTENTNASSGKMPPLFYLKQWPGVYEVDNTRSCDSLSYNWKENPNFQPSFVLFEGDKNLKNRIDTVKKQFPLLEYEATFVPGFVDRMLYTLNPMNANETIYIYRNKQRIAKKKN